MPWMVVRALLTYLGSDSVRCEPCDFKRKTVSGGNTIGLKLTQINAFLNLIGTFSLHVRTLYLQP